MASENGKPLLLPSITQQAVVLGSGPAAMPPQDSMLGWALLTVNGSQALAAGWETSEPALTIFGTTVLGMRPSNLAAQRVLRGRRTRCLVLIRDGSIPLLHDLNLMRIGYHADRRVVLKTEHRRQILESVIGGALAGRAKPSNGIFLAIVALYVGCPRVLMTGFSLSSCGHGYNDSKHPRNHAEADREILAKLVDDGAPISTNDLAFSSESGVQLHLAD